MIIHVLLVPLAMTVISNTLYLEYLSIYTAYVVYAMNTCVCTIALKDMLFIRNIVSQTINLHYMTHNQY